MEAASEKKKRGRPTVYAKEGAEDIRNQILQDKGGRMAQNEYYIMEAISAIERLSPAGSERLYFIPDNIFSGSQQEAKRAGYKRDCTILEQLGRAVAQDHYSDDVFLVLAEKAATLKGQGCASKDVAKWIRKIRATIKLDSDAE